MHPKAFVARFYARQFYFILRIAWLREERELKHAHSSEKRRIAKILEVE